MSSDSIAIAGGGIGGLALGLTLHQVGIDFTIYESVSELRPLGVGVNLQPNAVRELFELGFSEDDLNSVGVPVEEWALVGLNGREIYSEPRGLFAGYTWPQFAVHRGRFHMLLYETLIERAGHQCIQTGHKVIGYTNLDVNGVEVVLKEKDEIRVAKHSLLIGCDGIHSEVRAKMHPTQPPIHWGGALMWRGTTIAKPVRTGASFLGLGADRQRMVIYPISPADPVTGMAEINWIAEITYDDPSMRDNVGWFQQVKDKSFVEYFRDWTYEWLNVPELLNGSGEVYENAMIDRDPVATWVDGSVALLGDAAHAMYPTGSNGASQAIVDARMLAASFLKHGISKPALKHYDETLCGPISELVLRNRGSGPFGLLSIVDERCGGVFEDINEIISQPERDEFMEKYKKAAGFAKETLNAAPPIISKESFT